MRQPLGERKSKNPGERKVKQAAYRIVATFAAFVLVINVTASGIVAAMESIGGVYQRFAFQRPGMYTENPRPVYRGPNPRRDPVYRRREVERPHIAGAKKH